MGTEENRTLLEEILVQFNDHNAEWVRQIAADDYVDHATPEGFGAGVEASVRYLTMLFEAFPDLHLEPLDIVADARRVAGRVRLTGTHEGEFMGIPPTGQSIDIEEVGFLRCDEDGSVTDHWSYMDTLDLLQQLGVAPVPADAGA